MVMWFFLEMRNSGCRFDIFVYNVFITVYLYFREKFKVLDKAFVCFDKMKVTDRCKFNIVIYNIFLRVFV